MKCVRSARVRTNRAEVRPVRKSNIFLTVLPLCIAMIFFSVGFGSWSVILPDPITPAVSVGGIGVDNVYHSSDYVAVSAISTFDYSSLHFLTSSGATSDTGSVTVTCTVDIDACRDRMQEKGTAFDGALTLCVSLFYKNLATESYALFAPIDDGVNYRSVSAKLRTPTTSTPAVLENGGTTLLATATLTDLPSSGEYTCGVEFVLHIPENLAGTEIPANFRQCFGQYLKNFAGDKTEFVATAYILDAA